MSAKLQAKFDEAYAQHERGNLDRAEIGYKAVLKQLPDHAPSLYLLGLIAYGRKQYKQAVRYYKQVLEITPGDADAYFEMANAYHELKELNSALACINHAIRINSFNSDYLCNRGLILRDLERPAEALKDYDTALSLNPDDPDLWFNRGNALSDLARYVEALVCYKWVSERDPHHVGAWANSGRALHELKQFQGALACFQRVLTIEPDSLDAHHNVCDELSCCGRHDEAMIAYDLLLEKNPMWLEGYRGKGLVHQRVNQISAAIAAYQKALAIDPSHPLAHYSLGYCYLLQGNLDDGWPHYDWRLHKKGVISKSRREFPQPLWRGEDVSAGTKILIHSEQGIGDLIQLSRYIPLLAERGFSPILEGHSALKTLLGGLRGLHGFVEKGAVLPDFDCFCPLMSLPGAFRTNINNIPSPGSYLAASVEKISEWSSRLGEKRKFRIGLAWSGNPAFSNDHNRSVSLKAFSPLLDLDLGVEWFSVQKDIKQEDLSVLCDMNLGSYGEYLQDFSDTAALLSHMDLVISVDTSVAHLAGALGRPVWIMLPFSPDWRWMLNREDSPWYSSARLFRQLEAGEWGCVIENIRRELKLICNR